MQHIVKRAGHPEQFDSRKIYGSVYAACLAVRAEPNDAELIASEVSKDLTRWIEDKASVTSDQIAAEVVRVIKLYNNDAAYLYLHHRDIS